MRCVDVNVLVYAHRPDVEDHEQWRVWLDDARRGVEPVGLIPAVATGFLRIVTHPRIFLDPTPLGEALDFLEAIRRSPAVVETPPGAGHLRLVDELCRATSATGNRVPDAALAATAIEHGASFVTADRGFVRYPGLEVIVPF